MDIYKIRDPMQHIVFKFCDMDTKASLIMAFYKEKYDMFDDSDEFMEGYHKYFCEYIKCLKGSQKKYRDAYNGIIVTISDYLFEFSKRENVIYKRRKKAFNIELNGVKENLDACYYMYAKNNDMLEKHIDNFQFYEDAVVYKLYVCKKISDTIIDIKARLKLLILNTIVLQHYERYLFVKSRSTFMCNMNLNDALERY